MSETPRTEEAKFSGIHAHPSEEYVAADFARELERELNEQVLANGKGGEREAALIAKVARLERDNLESEAREGESFSHACSLCETLKAENPSSEFCVNTGSSLSQVANDAPLLPSDKPKSSGPRR